MNVRPALAALAATALVAVPALAAPSAAHAVPPLRAAPVEPTDELASDLLTPLSLAYGADGTTLYLTQNLRGAVMRAPAGEAAYRIYQAHGHHQVGGVSVTAARVYFTLSGDKETFGRLMSTKLVGGKAKVVADLGDYERAQNPDGDRRYGIRRLSSSCAAKFPANRNPSALGKAQTNPYATLVQGSKVFVADAGANSILRVNKRGRVHTVTLLPSVRTTVTEAFAADNRLPGCTVGKTWVAEAVPTDVVAGPDGTLYVTTLGGGPAALGGEPGGAVWQVDARSGRKTKIAGGLDTPTGVTVAPDGDLYVAELYADQIVRIPAGTGVAEPFVNVGLPGDVVATPTGLVASTNVLSGSSGKSGDPVNGVVYRYPY